VLHISTESVQLCAAATRAFGRVCKQRSSIVGTSRLHQRDAEPREDLRTLRSVLRQERGRALEERRSPGDIERIVRALPRRREPLPGDASELRGVLVVQEQFSTERDGLL
jgi:hypothetical protein